MVYPFIPFVIRLLQGDDTKRIHVAGLVDVHGPVDAAQPLAVLADDVGNLQAGDVEILRGRVEHHAVVGTGV